jgi:hypothetical protein
VKDQPLPTIDDLIAEIRGKSIEEIVKEEAAEGGEWLISVDELRAAGALDVPPWMRKSLRNEPHLFADVSDDAGPRPDEACPAKGDTDDKASSDEGVRPQADGA